MARLSPPLPQKQPAMRFGLDAAGLARSHFVLSRLVQIVTGLALLNRPGRAPYARPWVEAVRREIRADEIDLLLALCDPPSWFVPDFMAPIPRTFLPSVDEELAAVAQTSAKMLATQLAFAFHIGPCPAAVARVMRTSPELADRRRAPVPAPLADALAHGPEEVAARAATQLRLVWRRVLEPHWPRIQQVLEDDVLRHGREVSRRGAAAMFEGLAPEIGWDGDAVSLEIRGYTLSFCTTGPPLLTPCIFLDRPNVLLDLPTRAMFAYPARGRAAIWSPPDSPRQPAELIGGRRRALIADLAYGRTTSDLARRHRLRASTVSYHLGLLHDADLVVRRRLGREVLYERTDRATAILAALEPSDSPPSG